MPPPARRPRGRTGKGRLVRTLPTVSRLLPSRSASPPAASRSRARLPLLCFVLGLTLGTTISGKVPQLMGSAIAGLAHAPRGLAALVDPLGIGQRRVLVMGTDAVGENTDVMFTVRIHDGTTSILQVPRDTYIESERLGVLKANALYAAAGMDTAKAEVGKLVASPVDRYVRVNLNAVARLADAMGGVEVDVPKRMYYVDNSQGLYIDLYPGRQLLKGRELEGFLRFRHDEAGDLGRMDRQRLVINQVFTKLAQPATLTRLPELIRIAGEDIHTDLSPIEMTQLVTALRQSKLSTGRLPGRLYWQDDLSYWMPDSNLAHPTGNGEEPSS
jgi:polyisoprenyl-teichoic acid--peptidoglycan teichoic acid transferase